jgi:hypothetical protein
MAGVDDLDVVRRLDVGGSDDAFAILAQAQRDFVAVVQLEHHALEVQQDADHVFLHAVDRRVLVQDASDGDFSCCITHHGRQQHTAQGVAQRVAVAALERLQRHFGTVGAKVFHVDGFGFQQLVCIQTSSQYPRLVTPVRLVKCPAQGAPHAGNRKLNGGMARPPRALRRSINANTVRRSAIR